MLKKLTRNQMLGEIGEAAACLQFLTMGFQFDGRSRLEAGIDGSAEVMVDGHPIARMIAVQVKAKEVGQYTSVVRKDTAARLSSMLPLHASGELWIAALSQVSPKVGGQASDGVLLRTLPRAR